MKTEDVMNRLKKTFILMVRNLLYIVNNFFGKVGLN